MKILRTILWVLAALGFLVFAIYNWQPVELTLWQNLVLETKLPVLALLAFALGFLPTWGFHRSVVWGLHRRIRALENSLKNSAMARQANAQMPTAAPVEASEEKPGKNPTPPVDPLSPTSAGDAQ